MNNRQIRDLALKILGIFYLSTAFQRGLQVVTVVEMWQSARSLFGYNLVHLTVLLLTFAFWLSLGLVLTFRTRVAIAVLWPGQKEETEATAVGRPFLRVGVVLIGLYFFVRAAGDVFGQLLIRVVQPEPRPPFPYYLFLPAVATMVVGILCIVMAPTIEGWLMRSIGVDRLSSGKPGDAPAEIAQE